MLGERGYNCGISITRNEIIVIVRKHTIAPKLDVYRVEERHNIRNVAVYTRIYHAIRWLRGGPVEILIYTDELQVTRVPISALPISLRK